MLVYILLPLIVGWLFKRFRLKRIYLTYVIKASLIIFIPLGVLIMRTIFTFSAMGAPDTSAFAIGFAELFGNIAIPLFMALFFQYIFNKTMGLNRI